MKRLSPRGMIDAMRCFLFAAFGLVAACATVPAPPAPPAAAAARPAVRLPDDNMVAASMARAGKPDAPTLDQMRTLVGAPDLERRDGMGIFQTYRLEPCALLLSFVLDARGVQRLQAAQPNVRRVGDAAPDPVACFAAAAARGRKAQS